MKSIVIFAFLLGLISGELINPFLPQLRTSYELDNRIVGGEEAQPHAHPYQVALWVQVPGRTGFCGGSLISPNYVMTAAHCLQTASSVEVVLGAHKIKDDESSQVRLNSSDFYIHEKWSMLSMTNDIALIKLPEAVEFTDKIQPTNLPTKSDAKNKFENEPAIITGWGKDSDAATEVSPVLRKVHVPILDHFTCKLAYFGVIQDSHICTNSQGGKGTCNGDSGGPLVLEENHKQLGIVSFGLALGCELGWPAAYTRVTSFLDWIEEHSDVKIEN